ncbi:unnamed protein product, partial [marine sediment metagenome]
MKILNGTGCIEDLNYKKGSSGWFYKLKIDGRNYNGFEKDFQTSKPIEAYKRLREEEFNLGDEVVFEYSEHEKDGTTYKNLLKISKAEDEQLGETGAGVPTGGSYVPNFVEKKKEPTYNDRMVRMNALRHAINFFELNKEVVAMNLKEGDSLNQA